jgi:hypothetical protein
MMKFEVFVQVVPKLPSTQILGFELLRTDSVGHNFGYIKDMAKKMGIPMELLGLYYLARGLETIEAFAKRLRGQVDVRALMFTINLDHDIINSHYFRQVLDHFYSDAHCHITAFEINEHCLDEDIEKMKEVVADYNLRVGLDDSDKMKPRVRAFASQISSFFKLDAFTAIPLFEDRGKYPAAVLAELARHRKTGSPYVIEGIEKKGYRQFLENNWAGVEGAGSQTLWGQGYALPPTGPYDAYLEMVAPHVWIMRDQEVG